MDDWYRPKRDKIADEKPRNKRYKSRKAYKPTVKHLTDKLKAEVKHYRFWNGRQESRGKNSWWGKWAEEAMDRHFTKIKALACQIKVLRNLTKCDC